ncbi:MAG: hypothetical protein ACE5ER_06870 [Nitrospinaceae bacterium]
MTPRVQVFESAESAGIPKVVAVLPFTMEAGRKVPGHPEKLFRQVFFDYFSYLGYRDLPLEDVDKRLKRAGHWDPVTIFSLPAAELRRILKVDAVVRGRILDANNFTGGVYAETRLEGRLDLVDLNREKVIWQVDHHEIELSGIAQSTVVTMVQDQLANSETQEAYFRAAEAFTVKVLEKIPDPANWRPPAPQLPGILGIWANVEPGKVLQPGDLIEVTLTGDAGLTATFDIGSARTRLPMKEVRPGVYRGVYQVTPGDHFGQSLIIGRLEDAAGQVRKKVFKTPLGQANV